MRQKILALAEELGYPGPHAAARTLRRGRTDTLGVLFTDALSYAFSDPAAVLFLQGVAEATEQAGIGLLLLPTAGAQSSDPAMVNAALVDSFLVYSVSDDNPILDALLARGLPVVIVDQPARIGSAYVTIDDRAAARAIAEHVLALGHRHLAVVTFALRADGQAGPVDRARLEAATFPVTRARLAGFADAIAAAGLDWDQVAIEECAQSTREAGHRAGSALFDRPVPPTAVLATSDQLALGVWRAAAERGLRVPEDVSITGFDDIPVARWTRTPLGLTTVRQPLREKGLTAARLALAGWSAGDPPRVTLPTELMVRGSTGSAPDRPTTNAPRNRAK